MTVIIQAIGVDAAFANMGFAHVDLYIEAGVVSRVDCIGLALVSTVITEDRKVVRKSSTELRRAMELHTALQMHSALRRFAFVEVPSGSQSAAAARALGIAVGVLASCPIPIIEVNPQEVKEAVAGRKKGPQPSKAEVIDWAVRQWPHAQWIRHKRSSLGRVATKGANKGKVTGAYRAGELTNDNEHLADALGSVAAGIRTPEFLRSLALMAAPAAATVPARRVWRA